MHIVVVGLNYRSAPIELREKLAFTSEQLPQALARLRVEMGLRESAILSTCNRIEIYAGVPDWQQGIPRLQHFLSSHGRLDHHLVTSRCYQTAEPGSVQHLFAVASGLDSMVLGESEILHQVKRAYAVAKEAGSTGKVFNVLFQRAFNAAKAVRSQTAIGQGCASIATLAVELSEKIFGRLNRATVVLVGAGKIGEATLKHLVARGASRLRIVNRTADRIQSLAQSYAASLVSLDQLQDQLLDADIVISSATAPAYLLRQTDIAQAMRTRHHRPLCLIDLGLPRNIDPASGRMDNVYLFNIDDLQELITQTYQQREASLSHSRAILHAKVEHFLRWWTNERSRCTPHVPSVSELVAVP